MPNLIGNGLSNIALAIRYNLKARVNNAMFKLRTDEPRGSPVGGGRVRAIYRISDGSYEKERFPYATKETCLKNFLAVFEPSEDDLLIIADNVKDATWDMVSELHPHVVRTHIGHGAGSWRFGAFDVALAQYSDDEVVYFVEDDYIHRAGAREVLLEGLAVADYVSLYDHQDKYISTSKGGHNPFIKYGGEMTRVIRTEHSHWKLTNSTTMTFAITVGALREDKGVWDRYTRGRHPHDFHAFLDLGRRGRSLVTPVPGYSTHCEPMLAAPGIDWEMVAGLTVAHENRQPAKASDRLRGDDVETHS
jgi:hypothetical protein